MNLPGGWELVLVCLVIMVLFGAKRLPEASRSLGRSLRIFKAETKGLRDDDEARQTSAGADNTPTPARELEGTVPDREPIVPRSADHEARER